MSNSKKYLVILMLSAFFAFSFSAAFGFAQLKENGYPCIGNSECQSNICSNGYCSSVATTTTVHTSTCSSSSPHYCYTQSECTGVGAQWCNSYCSTSCPSDTTTSSTTTTAYTQTTTTLTGQTTTTLSGQTTTTLSGQTTTTAYVSDCPLNTPITAKCRCGSTNTYSSGYCCGSTTAYNGAWSSTACTGFQGGTGTKTDGSSCSLNSECSSGFCSGGRCGGSGTPGYPGDTSTTSGTGGWCGDGKCGSSEGKYSCSKDCGVASDRCNSGRGNGVCESGEDYMNCHLDCPEGTFGGGGFGDSSQGGWCGDGKCSSTESSSWCPEDCGGTVGAGTSCGDGICSPSETEFGQYPCSSDCGFGGHGREGSFKERTPLDVNVPEGCRMEFDHSGFSSLVCEQREMKCPSLDERSKDRCESEGGVSHLDEDNYSGCQFYRCDFKTFERREKKSKYEIGGVDKCPTPFEIEGSLKKCEKFGGKGVIRFEGAGFGGCDVADCIEKHEDSFDVCAEEADQDIAARIKEDCKSRGLGIFKKFDNKGCPITACGSSDECHKDIPEEAFDKCSSEGGTISFDADEEGCITRFNCLRPGDEDDLEFDVEEITEVPDVTVLLDMALKLQDLKVNLDKLERKTEKIKEYYSSVDDSTETRRFEKVKELFEVAKSRLEDVREQMLEVAQSDEVTKSQLIEIKREIKKMTKVLLKDLLFVMLAGEDDFDKVKLEEKYEAVDEDTGTKDCRTNGACFDRNFRKCKPVTFLPEGTRGPEVEVTGLDDNGACVMHVELPEGEGPPAFYAKQLGLPEPPYFMDCAIPDYEEGVMNPEEDVFPHCEGPMVKLMEAFPEGGPGGSGGPGGRGGPGGPGEGPPEECMVGGKFVGFDECEAIMIEKFGGRSGGPGGFPPEGPEGFDEFGDRGGFEGGPEGFR